jgi:hypothetical protein
LPRSTAASFHEEDAAVAHGVHALAAVGVGPDPDDLDVHVGAELARQALAHHVLAAHRLGVGVGRHLVVDAPDVVGHEVLPDRAVLVERRLDPGMALHRRVGAEAHIGDAPAVVAAARIERHLEPLAQRAVRAGGVDHVLGLDAVAAGRCFHRERGAVGALLEGGQAVLPAQLDHAQFLDALDQEALDVELLDIDEGRLAGEVEVALLAQVEAVDLVVAGEGAAHAPLHALGGNALEDAQALEDLQRLLCVADAARGRALHAHGVVFVDQHRAHAQARQRARHGEAGDAATHDDHGVAHHGAALQFGRGHEGVFGQYVAGAAGELVAVGEGGLAVGGGGHSSAPLRTSRAPPPRAGRSVAA